MYKNRNIVGKPEFPDQFSKVVYYEQKGHNIDVMKQSAFLAIDQTTVDHLPL